MALLHLQHLVPTPPPPPPPPNQPVWHFCSCSHSASSPAKIHQRIAKRDYTDFADLLFDNLYHHPSLTAQNQYKLEINPQQGRKKPRSDCPGQVNFALGQAKMEVWWPGGQVKLASAVLLVIIPVKNN